MTEDQFEQWVLLMQKRRRESEMTLAKHYFIFKWHTKFCKVDWRNRWNELTLGIPTLVEGAMIPAFTCFMIGRN